MNKTKAKEALLRIFETPRTLGISEENDSEFWKIASDWAQELSKQWTEYHHNIFSKSATFPSLRNRIQIFSAPSIDHIRKQHPDWLTEPGYFYWIVLFRAISAAGTDSDEKVRAALLEVMDVCD